MSKLVATMTKLKAGNLPGIGNHNQRKTDNHSNEDIDVERSHLNYDLVNGISPFNFKKEIEKYINETKSTPRAVRKDAVLVNEWIISSDTEFFEKLSDEETREFFERSTQYFQEKFGKDNVKYAIIHIDETTPHMHLGVVPFDKNNKLSAKRVFNRQTLLDIQEELPKHLEKFNIERGNRDPERKKLTVREYKNMQREIEEKTHNQRIALKRLEKQSERLTEQIKEQSSLTLDEKIQETMNFELYRGITTEWQQLFEEQPEKNMFGQTKDLKVPRTLAYETINEFKNVLNSQAFYNQKNANLEDLEEILLVQEGNLREQIFEWIGEREVLDGIRQNLDERIEKGVSELRSETISEVEASYHARETALERREEVISSKEQDIEKRLTDLEKREDLTTENRQLRQEIKENRYEYQEELQNIKREMNDNQNILENKISELEQDNNSLLSENQDLKDLVHDIFNVQRDTILEYKDRFLDKFPKIRETISSAIEFAKDLINRDLAKERAKQRQFDEWER